MHVLPDDETGAAITRWVEEGSDVSRPMVIDFFVAVPSQKAGECVASEARFSGFSTSVEFDSKSGEWTCYCTREFVPTYMDLNRQERLLDDMASQYGGRADGFGSYGNASGH